MNSLMLASVVFLVCYLFIIWEKIPNTIVAVLGAFLLLGLHVLEQEEAVRAIDFNTIGLLCGMMMIVAVLRKTGVFEYIAIRSIKVARGRPWRVLVSLSVVTAVLSALLDNVTTVLIVVPITFAVCDSLRVDPVPFLIAEMLFANIGGTATLIGDPPNILIGGSTELGFLDFLTNNGPIVLIVSVFVFAVLGLLYGKRLRTARDLREILSSFDETRTITNRRFLIQSLSVFSAVMLGFITHGLHHVQLASVALGGAFVLLLITRESPEEILKEVEWPTLFYFIGLFILIGALEKTGAIASVSKALLAVTGGEKTALTVSLLWLSAFAAPLLSSVPYTATMISIVKSIGVTSNMDITPLWWALSLGACFGATGTVIGSAANIIVVGFARTNHHPISFGQYLKIGFPLMVGMMAITTVYVTLRYL